MKLWIHFNSLNYEMVHILKLHLLCTMPMEDNCQYKSSKVAVELVVLQAVVLNVGG